MDAMSVATFKGRSVRYQIGGPSEGPMLVLSHSLGTSLRMWDEQARDLAHRWRVMRYDTRGHGGSSVPPGPYTIEELAGDVVELLDMLEVESVHFCGLSMGGLTGLYLASTYPDRVLTVAVCSAAARLGTRAMWDSRIESVRQMGMQPVASSVGARWFTPGFLASRPDVVSAIEQQVLDTSREGYIACCGALRDADLRPTVSDMRTRILVLAGAHDPAVPVADARWLASHLPRAEYDELPAAHLSNVEASAAFTDRLSKFLDA